MIESKTHRLASVVMMRSSGLVTPAARDVLLLVDHERVSSAPGIVTAFLREVAAIQSDRTLSDVGKAERIKPLAASRLLGPLASVARDFVRLEAAHAQHRARLLEKAAAPNDAAVVIDLALAAKFESAGPATTHSIHRASQRSREALARMPRELTGLTAEQQLHAIASLIPGTDAVALAEVEQALESAKKVIQSALDELQGAARSEPDQLVRYFGASWALPGVAASLAQRMVDKAAAADAASEAASEPAEA